MGKTVGSSGLRVDPFPLREPSLSPVHPHEQDRCAGWPTLAETVRPESLDYARVAGAWLEALSMPRKQYAYQNAPE